MRAWAEIEGLFISKYESIKTLLSMTALEAKLTQLTVVPFLITITVLMVVLLTLWATFMGILGCLIWELQHRLLWVFCSLFLVNTLMLFTLYYRLRYYLRHMKFQKTRQYFKFITSVEAHEPTQAVDSRTQES